MNGLGGSQIVGQQRAQGIQRQGIQRSAFSGETIGLGGGLVS